MTALVVVALAAFAAGRLLAFHHHVESDFAAWRDRVTGAALLPAPTLDLIATEIEAVR